ncbi:hypothetical protein RI065_06445 [Mycoplasmatota bacterium zrk1]
MSCIRKSTVFETVEVTIKEMDKDDIDNIREKAMQCIASVLDKLNTYFKNLEYEVVGDELYLYDEYLAYPYINEIMLSFGFELISSNTTKNGTLRTYKSSLLYILDVLESNITTDKLTILNDSIRSNQLKKNMHLAEILNNIKANGEYTSTVIQEVENTYEDDRLKSSRVLSKRKSKELESVQGKLELLKKEVNSYFEKHNRIMREGTKSIVVQRAKQMGYRVEEIQKDNSVELVLVRGI